MKSLVHATAVSLVLACAGCATSGGPTYSQVATTTAKDKGDIVVYRWRSLKGAAWTNRVFIDGQHVADLRSGEFTRFAVSPGEHKLSVGSMSNPNSRTATLQVSPGSSYFFEDYPGYNIYAPAELTSVDQPRAEKRLASYTFHAPLNSNP